MPMGRPSAKRALLPWGVSGAKQLGRRCGKPPDGPEPAAGVPGGCWEFSWGGKWQRSEATKQRAVATGSISRPSVKTMCKLLAELRSHLTEA